MTTRAGSSAWMLAAMVLAVAGCGDDGGGSGEPSGPYFRFDLPADASAAIPMADLPFPNDALLGADGTIQVTEASLPLGPQADRELRTSMTAALARRHGFGVFSGALFPVAKLGAGETLDPTTLDGKVELVSLPDGATVPVEITAKPDGDLHVQPALGHVLAPHQRYAYLVRAGVKTTAGAAVAADPDLTAVLTSNGPAGPAARAASYYDPLRTYLAAQGIAPSDVVDATVFTTADYTTELVAARTILDARPPAAAVVDHVYHRGAELDDFFGQPADDDFPGHDNPGGIAHSHLAGVVLGHFGAADFTSAEPRTLGRWEYDADGKPVVKGTEQVPFMLTIPQGADLHDLPVIVFGHGFGSSREVVADVANTMASYGFAVIGVDSPSHGDRFTLAQDTMHNYTGAGGPDGLADPASQQSQLEFLDVVGDAAHGVSQLDPQVMSAAFRQAAVDIMSEVRLVAGGDWSALDDDFPGLGFRADRIVYSGQSMGGLLGTLVTAIDPRVGAAVLGVPGGGLVQLLAEDSPDLWPTFGTILVGALGVDPADAEPGVTPPHTNLGFMIVQMLLEDADPLVYAGAVVEAPLGLPKHVAVLNAFSDETVPNQASEALAAAMGLEWMPTALSPSGPRYIAAPPTRPAPVEGNLTVDGTAVTAGWVMLTPASHGMQTGHGAQSAYEPGFPPFRLRAQPVPIENPIVGVQTMTGEFARTYVDTGTPRLVDPF
ncbi:MAG TPA: hypothetical protein VHE35_13585 [Kofleriaceae bacterium]|nr:hypothetical protein [Kofleriaceae bacterium]